MNNFLDKLPNSWEIKTLGEINQKKLPSINPQNFKEEIFEYYSIPAYQTGGLPFQTKGEEINSNKTLLEPETILFGKLNPRVEKVWKVENYTEHRKIGSTEWIPIKAGNDIDTNFLYFLQWSTHVMLIAKTLVSGSTPSRQRVDPKSFYKIKVPLPPLPEQKKIAHILSTVQQAIEQQEQIIALTTELKKALMYKLFTEGLHDELQKETEIGLVPESWEVMEFEQFTTLQRGKDLTRKNFKNGGIPVAGSNGIIGFHNVANVFGPGVTVGRSGSAGKVTYYETDFWAHNTSLYVKDFHCNHPKFAAYYLEFLKLDRFKSGASVPTLDRNQFRRISIGVPPREQQIKIADMLSILDSKIVLCNRKRGSLNDLFRTLLHQLMTAQIRVHELEFEEREEQVTESEEHEQMMFEFPT